MEDAADLGAQLPLIIRGIYHEGWKPAALPVKTRDRDEFLAYIRGQMGRAVDDLPPEKALEAVLTVLHEQITEGEMEDIRKLLPEGLRQLWSAADPA